jgi:hypothetical protein
VEKYETTLKLWEIRNEHACSIILSTLLETYQIEVIGLENAKETWDVICSKFDNQSEMVQIDLLRQMNQSRCPEDADPRETIQALQTLRAKYASAGGYLKPAQFTAIILSTMPDRYHPLLHALIATTRVNKLTLNPNNLISHITEAAKHDFAQEQAKKDDSALAAQNAGKHAGRNNGNNKPHPKREGKCGNCGKEGHWKEDCWAKGGGKEGQ